MPNKRTFLDNFYLFLKGITMGAANKVPGVSGGTVSYVFGFYEELIYSFKKINITSLKLLITGQFKAFFYHVNGPFLLLVMGGSLFSYFSISLVLDYFLKHYELYVWSWFFGMIIGSIFYMSKDFKAWNTKNRLFLCLGVLIGVGISFLEPAKENDALWFVFICGIVGVSGMTLPGLSGSFILILMGNYVLLLVDAVNELLFVIANIFSGDFDVLQDPTKLKYLKIISVFTAGSIFGLIAISHVLAYVLKRYNNIVNAIIIGFISGSLGIIWPWKKAVYLIENNTVVLDSKGQKIIENYTRFIPDFYNLQTWLALLFVGIGIVLILILDYYGQQNK